MAFASKDTKATHIIDIASLTGAQLVTTGNMHAALLSNDADFESLCFTAGQTSGDFTFPVLYAPEIVRYTSCSGTSLTTDTHWQLMQEFESKVADAKNSVANRMNAQASCAGHFIGSHLDENWLKAGKWAHIDAAGPTFTADRATGFGVNLLATIAHDVVN